MITHVYLVGTGLVGGTLLEQLRAQQLHEIRVIGLGDTQRMRWSSGGIALTDWKKYLATSREAMHLRTFIERMKNDKLPRSVFIDCTASEEIALQYADILASGISVVTPNKKANSGTLAYYHQLRAATRNTGAQFLYETNVGAGLPIIGTLRDLIRTGDTLLKIEGILSGTLSYIFSMFTGKKKFSDAVREAREKGYTEPDPRDDLNGMDVARKLLILAREIGLQLELKDIRVENLTPRSCRDARSVDAFFSALEQENDFFEAQKHAAEKNGKSLRYIASLQGSRAEVALLSVGKKHPCQQIDNSDNIIIFSTERYKQNPLVIRGPGAGAEVTAAGVFADLLRI